MRTIKRCIFLLCCACGLVVSPAVHAVVTGKEKPKTILKEKEREEIKAYFAGCLSGKSNSFTDGNRLKLSEVAECSEEVWQLWKEANQAFDEEKLIPLKPLSETSTGRWALPDTLEPHAAMPYYWGRKGSMAQSADSGVPMFLYLHGSGPKAQEWATGLKICSMFEDAPSVYFIPQIPNEGEYYRWWQKAKQFAWERLLRQSLLSGEVNPDRIYLFGISEGGYGSQRLASFYADYLAGAGPMAGGEPLKNAPVENCSNIAFSLRTGAMDFGFYRNLLTGYTAATFDSLQQQHPGRFVHHIELIPNMGHAIDYRPTTPWLKKFVRNPYPKQLSWENFEMDGLYRKGFYNLYVNERSNADDKTRTYYEMNISGNEIDLRVDEVVYETLQRDPRWGIELKFTKKYTPATRGKVTIYLCDELVDLKEKVTVTVNGKKVFQGKVKPDLKHMVNSCAAFFDPRRVYPAAIEVEL